MVKKLCDIGHMRIGYAKTDAKKKVFRSARTFDGANIFPGKINIDDAEANGEVWLDTLVSVAPGVTVVVPAMADIGTGAGQAKKVRLIEAAGGTIEVWDPPEAKVKGSPGRRQTVEFTDEQLASALLWWRTLSEADALAKIAKKFKLYPNRNRMNYLARKASK